MLTKNIGGAWRLRWGVIALTAIVSLALPVAASAAQGPSATGESIQYINVTVHPSAGTQTSEYDNSAYVKDTRNGHTPFQFRYKLWNSTAPIVTADNYAEADVSSCRHCGATAIAFQVVLVSKQTLAELTADDAAYGTTTSCTSCTSLAESFQIVYATDQASVLSYVVAYACNKTASELWELQYSGLSTAQIQWQSTALINGLIGELHGTSEGPYGSGGPQWSPAVHGAGQAAALTSTSQPVIDLLTQIHH
jgi:hypothetical protein